MDGLRALQEPDRRLRPRAWFAKPPDRLDRAVTDGRAAGFCLLVGDRRGRLVGATVVGGAAGEVIAELTARVKHRDRIDAVSTTVHAYPTMAEGPARAADEYLRRKYAQPLPRTIARLALGARRLTSPTN